MHVNIDNIDNTDVVKGMHHNDLCIACNDDNHRCHHHQSSNPTRNQRDVVVDHHHEAMIFALLVFISSLSIGHRLPCWELGCVYSSQGCDRIASFVQLNLLIRL